MTEPVSDFDFDVSEGGFASITVGNVTQRRDPMLDYATLSAIWREHVTANPEAKPGTPEAVLYKEQTNYFLQATRDWLYAEFQIDPGDDNVAISLHMANKYWEGVYIQTERLKKNGLEWRRSLSSTDSTPPDAHPNNSPDSSPTSTDLEQTD